MGKRHYLGHLTYDTHNDSLRAAFEQDGRSVTDVHVMVDRDTGQARGFGFVEMASEGDAQAAIQALDGQAIDGRNVKVNEAQERPNRGGGGRR